MKHLFFKSTFVFLALALLLGMSVSALAEEITIIDSGDCGTGLTYELNSAGVLTVSGNGSLDMVFYEEVPWFPHREMIRQTADGDVSDGVERLQQSGVHAQHAGVVGYKEHFPLGRTAVMSTVRLRHGCQAQGGVLLVDLTGILLPDEHGLFADVQ